MTEKTVTQSDLNNLEIKITKEQQELRHKNNDKLQEYYYIVDDLKTDSALSKQSFMTMTKSIEKLEKVVTDWFERVNSKIDWFQDKFSSREDHKENVSKIATIERSLDNINLKIAWVSGGFAVVIFLIDKWSKF